MMARAELLRAELGGETSHTHNALGPVKHFDPGASGTTRMHASFSPMLAALQLHLRGLLSPLAAQPAAAMSANPLHEVARAFTPDEVMTPCFYGCGRSYAF